MIEDTKKELLITFDNQLIFNLMLIHHIPLKEYKLIHC